MHTSSARCAPVPAIFTRCSPIARSIGWSSRSATPPAGSWTCAARWAIPIQMANTNQQAWRWKNVKNKCYRSDGLKLARLSAMDQLALVHVPVKTVREWRSLILYRHKLIDRRTSVRNAIHTSPRS